MRKHTPRKHYNPRAVILRQSLSQDQATSIGLMGWQSLDIIKRGKGTPADVHCLASCLNVCAVLHERGYGLDCREIVLDGLAALRRIMNRPKVLADGDGLKAIGYMLELYDEQIKLCTQLEFVDALLYVERAVGGR